MAPLSDIRPTLALLCAVALLLPPAAGAAQESPASTVSETIAGYEDVPWGATEAQIVSRYGEPIERRRLESGLNVIAYQDTLVGEPSIVLFGLLDEGGFVKAQEVVDLAEREDCIEMIRQIHRNVDLQYPLIRPAEQAKNNSPEAICHAAPKGLAFWHRQWRDESTGSVITVSLESGSEQVDLTYESRRFREWIDPESAARVQVLEDEGAPEEVLEPR